MYGHILICVGIGLMLTASGQQVTARKPAAKAAAPQGKFKAIWEPVPFSRDLKLNAIACVEPETCWVAGDKSTILHTKDGGKTWTVQLGGDTESTDEGLVEIFFLDRNHGWAMTERYRLLTTSDGSTWSELGKLPSLARSIWFPSPTTGYLLENSGSTSQSTTRRTDDGGKSWKPAYACTVEASIGGLARKLPCRLRVTRFVSPAVGFMGGGAAISMGTDIAAFAKTSDGGATWTTSIIPDTKHRISDLHFWSEKDGIALLDSGQVFWTADGGGTWTGATNSPRWKSIYAGAQGKILVGVFEGGNQIGYSFNGGRSFSSRPVRLPARVANVTFFDPQHGYLVGDHGMVFRYRVVPVDYNANGALSAAAAP